MTYLYLTLSLFWFQPLPDPCGLTSVICPEEQPAYIQEYIRDEFNRAGLDGDLAVKIVELESRFKADAIGTNRNGTKDFGYFQLNNYYWQDIIDDCFGKDNQLQCETAYAIKKVKSDKGFYAWTTLKLIYGNK